MTPDIPEIKTPKLPEQPQLFKMGKAEAGRQGGLSSFVSAGRLTSKAKTRKSSLLGSTKGPGGVMQG